MNFHPNRELTRLTTHALLHSKTKPSTCHVLVGIVCVSTSEYCYASVLVLVVRDKSCHVPANVAGWSYSQIQTKYPSIPISTINPTVYLANKRAKNELLPRPGRPRVLDGDGKAKLLNAIDENPRTTYDDLLLDVDNKVKKESIRRLLVEEGRRKWLVFD